MDERKGNFGQDSFSQLLEPILPLAYNYLYKDIGNKHIVEDILQNTLEKAHIGFKKFKGDSSFKTWFFKILVNEKYSLIKELIKQRKIYSVNGLDIKVSSQAETDRDTLLREFNENVEKLILKEDVSKLMTVLTEEEQRIIDLYYFKDRSLEQTANLMHKSEAYIKSKKKRIIDNLKVVYYINRLEEEMENKTDQVFKAFLKENLAKDERSLFVEVLMNKRSFRDIAEITGTDENLLRTRYLRILKKLADHIRRDER